MPVNDLAPSPDDGPLSLELIPDSPALDMKDLPSSLAQAVAADPQAQAWLNLRTEYIQQLHTEIKLRQEENDLLVAEMIRQNDALLQLNADLDLKIQVRTRELAESTQILQDQNRQLHELGELKEALMHMVVHDLKNPLAVVVGTLTLFRSQPHHFDPGVVQLLVRAHVQAVRLQFMIDEILTISRMQSKEFKLDLQPADLITLIRKSMGVISFTTGEKKAAFQFNPPAAELTVPVDLQLIERTLNNLMNNAIKYAPPDSMIDVVVSSEPGQVMVTVTNQGPVIPPEFHARIFDLFVRVDPSDTAIHGTGLGLAFCKLAVEAHRGKIWVESPAHPWAGGARFCFTLPKPA